MVNRRVALGLAVAVGLLTLGPSPAHAVPTLRLSTNGGTTWTTVVDEGAGDGLTGTPGAVLFVGGLGPWTLSVTTGLSDPFLPGPYPHMDLNSVNVSSSSGGTLLIQFTDTDFGPYLGSILGAIGGTLASGASLSYDVFVDPSNTPFGLASHVISLGPFFGGAFSGSDPAQLSLGFPFSVTQQITLRHVGAGVSSFDAEVRIPEPLSALLVGAGLLGMGILRSRKRT